MKNSENRCAGPLGIFRRKGYYYAMFSRGMKYVLGFFLICTMPLSLAFYGHAVTAKPEQPGGHTETMKMAVHSEPMVISTGKTASPGSDERPWEAGIPASPEDPAISEGSGIPEDSAHTEPAAPDDPTEPEYSTDPSTHETTITPLEPLTPLRILSFNIHHGTNADGYYDPGAIIETIRNSGADIIALQEVDRVWGMRSFFFDQARFIARKLGMHYVYGATLDKVPSLEGVGEYGLMILSRYPIVASEFHLLPGEKEQRGMLLAWVETPHGTVPVANTHLGLSVPDRVQQIAAILDILPGHELTLIMGDFNARPEAEELRPLLQRFADLQAAAGDGNIGTFLYRDRWVRIDYILAGRGWIPYVSRVLPDRTSDHRAVYAELIPPEPRVD